MKRFLLFAVVFVTFIFLQSCSVGFYQVFQTQSLSQELNNNEYKFENEHCRISYILEEKGGMSVLIANKTNNILTIDMNKSFFVKNEISFDYKNYSTHKNNDFFTIAPQTIRTIKSFDFMSEIYTECDFDIYDKEKTFDKVSSPLVFSNYLTYVSDDQKSNVIEHSFYVSKISNLREKDLFKKEKYKCGNFMHTRNTLNKKYNDFFIKLEHYKPF